MKRLLATYLGPGETLKDLLSRIPAPMRSHLAEGFDILGRLPEDRHEKLLVAVRDLISARSVERLKIDEIAPNLGISAKDVALLIPAAAIVTTVLSGDEEQTAEQLVQSATEAKVVKEAHKNAVLRFAQTVVRERASLEQAFERLSLGRQTLPSFDRLSISVDVRFGFQRGKIKLAVPVVIAYLDTDTDQKIWFQMNREQLEQIIEELTGALHQLQEAEQWVEKTFPSNK